VNAVTNSITLPKKPHPDFPLYPHKTDRWAKKVRGKTLFFGKATTDWDGQAALAEWNRTKDDLLAGRKPRPKDGDGGATVKAVCNAFLTHKLRLLNADEIVPRTFRDCKSTTDEIVDHFGKNRLVSDLRPNDFGEFRSALAKRLGPVALSTAITRVKAVFTFAYNDELIERPVRFGEQFARPRKKQLLAAKTAKGDKLFTAAEVKLLLAASGPQLEAMVLLGLNCGLGNSDVANLPKSALDLDGGWLEFPRPKTGQRRRAALWPETVKALQAAIASRPAAVDPEDDGLVFLTRFGRPWSRSRADEADDGSVEVASQAHLPREFRSACETAGVYAAGRGYYLLRHLFRTLAADVRDVEAVRAIMGHVGSHVEESYKHALPSDERLRAVADHVHRWLFATKS
jgi:integrase